MKFTSFLLMFFTFLNVNSQVFQCNDIIGKWTVKNARIVEMEGVQFEKGERTKLDSMKNDFINSTFIFNTDKTFQFSFNENVPEFMKELEFINNKKWKCNLEEGLIMIGTNEDNFSLIGIILQIQAEKTTFILSDSPFILDVIKN